MWWLFDIGNSRTKWRTSDGIELVTTGHADNSSLDPDFFTTLLSGSPNPEKIVVSNVAAQRFYVDLALVTERLWGMRPHLVRAVARCASVTNGYAIPESLGSDRWASMVGARKKAACDLFVVGCGTAITIDVLDKNGSHQGGVIAPGLNAMIDAMTRTTEHVRYFHTTPWQQGANELGRDTRSGAINGALGAAAGLLEHYYALYKQRFPELSCVITGGDALAVGSSAHIPWRHEPDLVFHGLLAIGHEIDAGEPT